MLLAFSIEVIGDLNLSGNGHVLIDVGVAGAWNPANGSTCDGCYSFSDRDTNGRVSTDEIGEPLDCSQE